jgi:hypothetical protein
VKALRTARRAGKKFQFTGRATNWDQLRISRTVVRAAREFLIVSWARKQKWDRLKISWIVRRTMRRLCIASWAMKGDQVKISKTAKRAAEAC